MRKLATGVTAFAVLAAGAITIHGSSHREAPGISKTPKLDGTDFYMFRSYESGRTDYVTLLANYLPLQDTYGGPNFFMMDPDAVYEIHVDNNGDAIEDLTFQFQFQNTMKNLAVPVGDKMVPIPLINAGGIGPAVTDTMNLNVEEHYTVSLVRGARRTGVRESLTDSATGSTSFAKPVDRIGDKSIKAGDGSVYNTYANTHIYTVNIPGCDAGGRVFVGQRREGFVVNLAETFDLINTNPLGPEDGEQNTLADKNVTTLALEVPTACLTSGSEPVIGAWTTASSGVGAPASGGGTGGGGTPGACPAGLPASPKPAPSFVPTQDCMGWVPPNHPLARTGDSAVRSSTLAATAPCPAGTPAAPQPSPSFVPTQDCMGWVPPNHPLARGAGDGSGGGGTGGGGTPGQFTQVSRLGNPLVNEVVIGLKDKDTFNGSEPRNDGQFLDYVTNPTLPTLVEVLFGVPAPAAPRNDLVSVFLTGVDGLNKPASVTPSEMLRLNTSIAPAAPASQNRLGVLGGDTAGFPNGRRPGDDVVDITLRAAEGILLAPDPSSFPAVTDGALASATVAYKADGTLTNDTAWMLYRDTFPYLQTPLSGSPGPIHP